MQATALDAAEAMMRQIRVLSSQGLLSSGENFFHKKIIIQHGKRSIVCSRRTWETQ